MLLIESAMADKNCNQRHPFFSYFKTTGCDLKGLFLTVPATTDGLARCFVSLSILNSCNRGGGSENIKL